jgi:hypothetical protein
MSSSSSSWPKSSEGTYASIEGASPPPTPRPEYPKRYYAWLFAPGDPGWEGIKGQVRGWVDAWRISSVENIPPADKMIPMTIEQWDYHNIADDHGIMLHLSAKYVDGEFYESHPA